MLPHSPHLDLEFNDRWLTVWFNDPRRRNPLTTERVDALLELCAALQIAPVQGVTFRGRGGVFCAGGDLKSFRASFQSDLSRDRIIQLSLRAADLFDAVAALPQFTVMAVERAAMAGGFGLACTGDLVIAADDTRFSLSEARIGLTPAQIAPFVVARIGMPAARRLMLTGATIDAREAEKLGLVDQIVANENMGKALIETQDMVQAAAPQAMAAIKRQLVGMPFQTREQQRHMAAVSFAERMLSEEAQEGISAFFEKRIPKWAGG
ncbi:enoyl-CoA hydratase/isomerase family protein [Ruegeria sp. Ofav3-42]|uniref:enoyl-CoA hydratase/isomerase family protein n=1 Tax=Ruegeria sp. Ofav3-42 TaxID=2917759 RepID=UPI001EF464D5|nr:enoyl-CoA hydratase/isomerase family protein [Ruegeria sp. Ofav3-42]MCG7521826.1 enoyl-CoA hydratase/isomerase family protein [Ruegeria sp. Ofav3-42]